MSLLLITLGLYVGQHSTGFLNTLAVIDVAFGITYFILSFVLFWLKVAVKVAEKEQLARKGQRVR